MQLKVVHLAIIAALVNPAFVHAKAEPFSLNFAVNGSEKGSVDVPFDFETMDVFVNQQVLKDLGINVIINAETKLSDLKNLTSEFDINTMSVKIKTDAALIESDQKFSLAGNTDYVYSKPLNSTYLNYALNLNDTQNALNFETGISFNAYQFHGAMSCLSTCLPSVFTAIKNDTKNLTKTQVGDFLTTEGDQILGFGFGTFYKLNPFFIRQPTASFSGVAQSQSKLEVLVDGVTQFSKKVEPGKFSVDDIRNISGRHDLTIQVTDAFGQVTALNQELFSTQNLLAAGLKDYQFNAGFKRKPNELSYDDFLASGFYRQGINDYITAGINLKATTDVQTIGVDIDIAFKNGASLFASTIVNNNSDFAASANLTNTNKNNDLFWSLNGQVSKSALKDAMDEDENERAFISASVTKRFNSFTLSTNISSELSNEDSRSKLTLSANIPVKTKLLSQSNITATTSIDSKGEYDLMLGLNFNYGNVSAGFKDGESTSNLSFFKNAQVQTELGVRASRQTNGSKDVYTANLTKGFEHINVNANCQSAVSKTNCDGILAGSLLYTKESGLLFSRPIRESFVVVNAGAPDVEVGVNGRWVNKTNKNGFLVLPEVPSYNYSQVNLNPETIDEKFNAEKLSERFMSQKFAGSVVDFGIKKVAAAYGRLNGFAVAEYTLDGKEKGVTSSRGEFYLENISSGKHSLIIESENIKTLEVIKHTCHFESGKNNESLENIGNIDCALIK